MTHPNRARLCLDFENVETLAEFVTDLRDNQVFPAKAAVYQMDVLDDNISSNNLFILRSEGDRDENTRLVVTSITTKTIKV